MASTSYKGHPRSSFQILLLVVVVSVPSSTAVVNKQPSTNPSIDTNVVNIENDVVNTTDETTTVDTPTTVAEDGPQMSRNKQIMNGDVREGRLDGARRYLKNNVTEVDFSLDRSESVKREGIYGYHHQPHHAQYQADDYLHEGAGHRVNFPHHHQEYEHHHGGYVQPHVHHHHSHLHDGHHHDLAVKAALGPLVGVALLGVVASLIANPVLLQLGVVGAGKRRRRRRRHAAHPALELSMITSLLSQVPKSSYLLAQERSMVDNYVKCSGLLSSIQDGCVLRLACELWNENSKLFQNQRSVVRRTLSEIMASELIPDHIRSMIYKASQHGKQLGQCEQYHCKRFEANKVENEEEYIRK